MFHLHHPNKAYQVLLPYSNHFYRGPYVFFLLFTSDFILSFLQNCPTIVPTQDMYNCLLYTFNESKIVSEKIYNTKPSFVEEETQKQKQSSFKPSFVVEEETQKPKQPSLKPKSRLINSTNISNPIKKKIILEDSDEEPSEEEEEEFIPKNVIIDPQEEYVFDENKEDKKLEDEVQDAENEDDVQDAEDAEDEENEEDEENP
jgi:hypothetical protein